MTCHSATREKLCYISLLRRQISILGTWRGGIYLISQEYSPRRISLWEAINRVTRFSTMIFWLMVSFEEVFCRCFENRISANA
jgi:hypothetical protein